MKKRNFVKPAATCVILLCVALMVIAILFAGCEEVEYTGYTGSKADTDNTLETASTLATNQPTPTDIEYSLERYNLIRRAYWVNGQREKANALVCEIEKPLGYVILFTESGATVGNFVVDGKVSSLNSYLSPDSEYYEKDLGLTSGETLGSTYATAVERYSNKWIADVDGSYGENDNGIFFFTPDGKYIEWTGIYLYSDIPFIVDDPVIRMEG